MKNLQKYTTRDLLTLKEIKEDKIKRLSDGEAPLFIKGVIKSLKEEIKTINEYLNK